MYRLIVLLLLLLAVVPFAAGAEPRQYRLDPEGSVVGFGYTLGGVAGAGVMPILSADLVIDFARLSASRAEVRLDVTGARAANALVTQALTGPEVLDAASHPEIRFVSRRVEGSLRDGARLIGDATIRGVTRPMVLEARVYRARDSAEGDLSRITVLLTGAIDRSAYGADGYADLVADRVTLDIRAKLEQVAR